MTKEQMLIMAERKIKKANIAFENNKNRPGITENELENLSNKLEYAKNVYELIKTYYGEERYTHD